VANGRYASLKDISIKVSVAEKYRTAGYYSDACNPARRTAPNVQRAA
jgi:hypothetical protein